MSPTDAARRTMLELANRKLPPTPTNYARVYGALAGGGVMTAAEAVELLCVRMPDRAAAEALHQAVRANDWRSAGAILEDALHESYERARSNAVDPHVVPAADKTESLDASSGLTPATAPPPDTQVIRRVASALLRAVRDIEPPLSGIAPLRARERVLYTLSQCEEAGELIAAIEALASAWQRTPSDSRSGAGSGSDPVAGSRSLHVDPEASPAALIQGIGEVIMLLVGEIEEVVPEGFLNADEFKRLRSLLGGTIDLGRLKDVKDATRSIIIKSGIARYGLSEAKRAVADMLDTLIQRASEREGGHDYELKFRSHGDTIARSSNLVMFTYGLHDLLAQISSFTTNVLRACDGLTSDRQRDGEPLRIPHRGEAAASVLDHAALEHAYTAALARTTEVSGDVCLAIIAIDETTKAREYRGDAGAEQAMLQRLPEMVHRLARTGDVVGRYSQNRIAIILPGTSVGGAKRVILGLQRSLTTSLFFRARQRGRTIVTFACGLTGILPGRSFRDAVTRASAGLEMAQREGRNKVVAA